MITLIAVLIGFVLGSAPPAVEAVEWLTPPEHDFGDLSYRQPVVHTFTFRNLSGAPLLIDNVRPSCGCTIPDWDKTAILPDSTGAIRVEYDARDKGYFRKYIKVYFHGQRKAEKLWIEGFVVAPEE